MRNMPSEQGRYFSTLLGRMPQAAAQISGSASYPGIHGHVYFYQLGGGVLVAAEIYGLPAPVGACVQPVFGFHIHEGEACSGDAKDPFASAGGHYNPGKCLHPYHAGDLPPLFGVNGFAFAVSLNGRFSINEIIGRTVIIHAKPDDFTTQPSGNSGEKIACGKIVSCKKNYL